MPGLLLTFVSALVFAAPPDTADDPRAVVRRALRAVEGDSARAVAARWEERLRRDPTDRAAALGLATVARLTYDYPAAERHYRELTASDTAASDRFAVYARLGMAQGLEAQGLLPDIDGLLVRARADAHALGDRAAEGEALLWLGITRALSQGVEVSLALLDSAARVLPRDAHDLRAACRCRRAHMLVVLGRPGASAELRSALEFARWAGAPRFEAYCLRALALDLKLRGQVDSSLVVLRTLEELRRRARDRAKLAETLALRADVLRDLAAPGEAMDVLHQALAEAEASHNREMAASVKLTLGAILLALNDHAAAAEQIDQAAAAYEALGDTSTMMMGRAWRASVSVAAGDFARARREMLEALAFFRRRGDVPFQIELYQALADVAMRERDWAAAERALDDASALMRRHGSTAAAAEQPYERGRLALYRGDLTVAERIFTRYLAGLDSTDRLRRYEVRARLAEVYARRGQLARAARELTTAGDELDAWRASLADRELRVLAFQASVSEENDRNASVARVLALLAEGGRAAAAFELAERRRAREVVDRLLQAEALDARDGRHPRSEPGAQRPGRATAADIAALIPDDSTAVVEYVSGTFGAPTTLFVLTRAAAGGGLVRARVLPPADSLASRIARFAALVESGSDPGALARALGTVVLEPALAELGSGVRRLVIVPDGPLHRVPFDALRLADGRYAAERYAISIAPSAAVVTALWRRSRGTEGPGTRPVRLLAFGDPMFANEAAPSDAGTWAGGAVETYRSAFETVGGLPRLVASAREVRLVARYASDAEVKLREAANAAYLKRTRLDSFRIVHFATHALVDERSLARTALALAPGPGESGFVGPGELAALRLNADLVVLSACRTAGGVVVDGEGVQGLTAPLLQAGARSVVATGWRIKDRSTVALVKDFYDGLARGLSVSEALRAAKLEAIGRGAPPSEWAAFTTVGDPLVTVPLREPSRLPRWWPVALAAVMLAAYSLAGGRWLARFGRYLHKLP